MRLAGVASKDQRGAVSYTSERLRMRPWRVGDLLDFHRIFGDGRVIWWGPEPSELASKRRLEAIVGRGAPPEPSGAGGSIPDTATYFAVELERTGAVVGNVTLGPAAFDSAMELGYHLAFDAWGNGYATEAAQATLQYAFGTLEQPRVVAAVAQNNARSLRVVERLGMHRVGEIERAGLRHDVFECRR